MTIRTKEGEGVSDPKDEVSWAERKVGLMPGSVVYTGREGAGPSKMNLVNVTPEKVEERALENVSDLTSSDAHKDGYLWIQVEGIQDSGLIKDLGDGLGWHPLLLEDIAHPQQRPKSETYGDFHFVVLRLFERSEDGSRLDSAQVSLVAGPDTLVSFVEGPVRVFERLMDRIRVGTGSIRTGKVPYLLYAIMDVVVDSYFVVMDRFGQDIEDIDDSLVDVPGSDILHRIHAIRMQLGTFIRGVRPLREVVHRLGQETVDVGGHGLFLRDLEDHVLRVTDSVDLYREMVSNQVAIHQSLLSTRTNEVMKVLTVIATIFIPLSFIAGVYGMNFADMPELGWRYGYPFAITVMTLVSGGMLAFFRRRKWI